MFGKNEPRHENGADTNGAARDDRTATAAPAASGRVQHSILSADVRLTGDLVSDGDITVEGTIDGSIKCRSLTLVGQPSIKGTVEAETVHVCGSFAGQIRASKVILNKTAKMRGDIYHETLEVQTGADFEGKVARLPAARSKATATPKAQASNGRDRSQEAATGVRSTA
jgi:cytoskeletal protein CcmA (bactofilin family)